MNKILLPLLFLNFYLATIQYTSGMFIDTLSEKNIPVMNFKSFESLLHQQNDTTYVINFWATWCKPCVEELPVFEMLNKKYASQKIKVLLVSLDLPENIQSSLLPFTKKNHIQSKIILLDDPDFNSWIEKVSPTWSGAIPATIIYNREKRKFYEQSFNYSTLTKELNSFIN